MAPKADADESATVPDCVRETSAGWVSEASVVYRTHVTSCKELLATGVQFGINRALILEPLA
jgi:hypothetical protein